MSPSFVLFIFNRYSEKNIFIELDQDKKITPSIMLNRFCIIFVIYFSDFFNVLMLEELQSNSVEFNLNQIENLVGPAMVSHPSEVRGC